MKQIAWNKRKATIAIALCTIIAVSSIIFLQNNQTTQAALINPHPGLVGWWSFNEGSGTVAGDSSGNGKTGIINGATWVDGKYGKALDFTGVNNYVDVLDPQFNTQSQGTISLWFKVSSLTAENTLLSYFENWNNYLFLYITDSGQIMVRFVISGVSTTYPVASGIQTGNWYQLVVVQDGVSLKGYLNAVAQTPRTTTNWFANIGLTSSSDIRIGRIAVFATLQGIIDEARIYNRALSQTEIQSDFNAGPDSSANILAKVPQGTTQVITTLSWQGTGNISVIIMTPSQNYTENMLPEYQKSSYSTSSGITNTLNIKRLSVSVTALPIDQNWNILLSLDKVDDYQVSVEVQK
jgi:hypothetical protein